MNTAAALPSRNVSSMPGQNMSGALLASFLFHFLVVLILIMGLPFLKRDKPDIMAQTMTVELVTVDEITQTNKPPSPKPKLEELEKPPAAPPRPPQVTSKTPPKPVAPEKPEEFVKAPDEKPEKAEVVEKPKLAKPKPEKKPILTREEPKPEEQQEEFKSLLRNLMPDEATTPSDKPSETKASPTTSPDAPAGETITSSELSALSAQLRQCWSILAGARYAENLVVDIKLFVNVDRTVRDAQIVDRIRYMSDSYYRAAADAAMRAVLNPHCSPLDLPADKYDMWKEIIVTFDPSELL
jgi:outer membrane biosynthesis protein TonB